MRQNRSPLLGDRLYPHVVAVGECLLWTRCTNSAGYGIIRYKGENVYAHRAAWILENGAIPAGIDVLHSCDKLYVYGDVTYRKCVRLDHLYLGDDLQNATDRVNNNRGCVGEHHHSALLTLENVLEIRRRYNTGSISETQLGKEFGVTQATISGIVLERTWKSAL